MSYDVRAEPGVGDDLRELAAEQEHVPAGWRLSEREVEETIDRAIKLIASLRDDPYQGELLEGRANARILEGCRRLKFDPLDPPPTDDRGRRAARMRLIWVNEPDESSIGLVRVLAVTHRFDSRPYRRAAARLGAVRRRSRRRQR